MVVPPENFHVGNLHVVFFDVADHFFQARNVATWEDVLVDPAVVGSTLLTGDSMDQCHPVILQVAVNVLEVETQIFLADVFEHPDGGNVIPGLVTEFPVVD